ncbi:MAG: hypothetical protein ACOZQL_33815 [Myxococcota bacterium]
MADKLRRSVAEGPIEHGETQPDGKVISVGAATLPHDASERAKLVDCADSALRVEARRTAKAEGDDFRRGGPLPHDASEAEAGARPPLQARHGERRDAPARARERSGEHAALKR